MTFHCLYFIFWFKCLIIIAFLVLSFYPSIWSWEFVLGICSTSMFHIRTLLLEWLVSYIILFFVFLLMLLRFSKDWSCFWNSTSYHPCLDPHCIETVAPRNKDLFTSSNFMLFIFIGWFCFMFILMIILLLAFIFTLCSNFSVSTCWSYYIEQFLKNCWIRKLALDSPAQFCEKNL